MATPQQHHQISPSDTLANQRLHGLDFIRALMMSLGVVLHTAQLYLTMDLVDYYWDPMRSVSMDALLIFINTFRMPTFFLLSGFFTALLLTRRGPEAMLKNRYQRLVIPFLIFLPPLAICMTILRIVASNLMATENVGFDVSLIDQPRRLWDNTHNLWFLYYLIMYVASVWLVLQSRRFLPESLHRRAHHLLEQKPIYSPAVILTVSLILAAIGSTRYAGRISGGVSFVPSVTIYLYFGICFLLGWMLYRRQSDIAVLIRRGWVHLGVACFSLLIALACFALQGSPGQANYPLLHIALSLSTGLSMCLFMLALVGIFSRYFHRYKPWIRYFSDSAYWVFILHSIPMVILALPMHSWQVAAEIKFLIVCTGTFLICLSSYHYWVRNTIIGELLNGRRYPQSPQPDS